MNDTVDRPVMVGVDGSPGSMRAVRWAAQAAELRRRRLLLVMAFQWPLGTYMVEGQMMVPTTPSVRDQARQELAEQVEAVRVRYPDLAVSGEFLEGQPAATLIEQSRQAALTVLGRRGRGGFAGLLLGSVSAQVSAHAAGPVVVVSAGEQPVADGGPVVVGMDGSTLSEPAIGFAFEQASWWRAELIAVHAWRSPGSDVPDDRIPLYYDLDEVADEERRMMAESLAGWRTKYPDVTVRPVLAHGAPAPELLAAAQGARLLVVGSRGRGGFAGLLLGSVSRTVLHHAPCPVAVVRPPA